MLWTLNIESNLFAPNALSAPVQHWMAPVRICIAHTFQSTLRVAALHNTRVTVYTNGTSGFEFGALNKHVI